MNRTTWIGLLAAGLLACETEPLVRVGDLPPSDRTDQGLACEPFALDYDATYHLELPTGAQVVDAATDATTIGVLTRDGVRVELHLFDRDTKDHLDALDVTIDGCELTSLTNARGAWWGLYSCADQIDVRELGGASVARLAAPSGFLRGARALAYDDARDVLWLHDDGVYRVAIEATTTAEEAPHDPLSWGPTSGFEHGDTTLIFARDAFEGGMSNRIAIEDDATGERCFFDVEETPGLEDQPNVRVFTDGGRLFALAPAGTLAELLWTDLR